MPYPWIITKVKELITGVSKNTSDITTLTPTPPPIGGIIDYYGSLDSSGKYPMTEDGHINYNWHVCDGTDGTPNLVGKTVIGANSDTYGDEGGSDTVTPSVTVNSATQSVSVNGHTLTTAELATHLHSYETTPTLFKQVDTSDNSYIKPNDSGSCKGITRNTNSTGSSAAHSHGVTTSAHTHTTVVGSVSTYQPYKALYKIMRLS